MWVPNWSSTLCDLGVFVYQPAEQIAASEMRLGMAMPQVTAVDELFGTHTLAGIVFRPQIDPSRCRRSDVPILARCQRHLTIKQPNPPQEIIGDYQPPHHAWMTS